MACKICSSGNTTSFGGQTPHIYCHGCGGHEYEGLLIEKKDWEDWVNERVDTPKSRPADADVQRDRQAALPWCKGVKLSQITHVADDGTQTPISLICDTCGASGPTAATHQQMAALWDARN